MWPEEPIQSDPLVIGYLRIFILPNASGCIEILEHPEFGRRVLDYDETPGEDSWCVLSHGSINSSECPMGDLDCVCPCATPIEAGSWGSVKAMFR